MGAHNQPARLSPPTPAAGTARAGAPVSRPPQRPRQARSLLLPFCLVGFCWFFSPDRKPDSPAPGEAVTSMTLLRTGLPYRQGPEFAPSPCTPVPVGAGYRHGEGI
ncbi:unnamed protein product [Rangifer tarandus platyrhynchus]|uniref:Uncharacterized protein n=1 Tax=Rangifer tarandus platyrhynchus TaxID=3082113 RepID=A0ABN8YFX7_RANTA|nr:unnamed protein product [Rangifer tarandus platyrhynchus]